MFGNNLFRQLQMGGLLGQPNSQMGGLLGGNTQNMMQKYLQNLYMRRYQPPMLSGASNTVRSTMGPGGVMYQAPTLMVASLPGAQQSSGQPWQLPGATYPQGSEPAGQFGQYRLNGQVYFPDGTLDSNAGNWSS